MREVFAAHVTSRHVLLHRISVVAAFREDSIAPETSDFFLVGGPATFGDMCCEDGSKNRVSAHDCVELHDNLVDLIACDVEAGRLSVHRIIQTIGRRIKR